MNRNIGSLLVDNAVTILKKTTNLQDIYKCINKKCLLLLLQICVYLGKPVAGWKFQH